MADRAVIVNADDFGLSHEVNQAVARAHREGVLSSASLLINAPATAEAVELAKELPDFGVGLHLALSGLAPLTTCPHLAPGGRFPAGHGVTYARCLAGRVPRQELRDEIRAQLDAALKTGLPIDHVDGHGHVHILPPVLEALTELAPEVGITAIRWPVEPPWERASSVPTRTRDRLARGVIHRLCRQGQSLFLRWRRPTGLFGLVHSGCLTRDHLLALAPHLPPGVTEIMTHPATVDEVTARRYYGARELAGLCDPEAAAALPPRVTFAAL